MKIRLVVIFLILSSILFAAEMVVTKELSAELGDLTLRQSPKTDMSGNYCALVKISTDLAPFDEIESNMTPVEVANKIGEVWIYLSPNDKRLYFNKSGYARFKYDIPITLQENTVYTMNLMGKGSRAKEIDNVVNLTFEFNVDGVYITRDNKAPIKASSTVVPFSISRGNHNFKFEKEGYKTVSKDINLQKDKFEKINLEAGSSEVRFSPPGIVIIQSEPEGATVELNGQKVGNTTGSYQGNHFAGEYTVTLRKDLYHPASRTFTLEAGQTLDISSIEMKPKFGYWQVNSSPSNADIYLDEKLIGKTPLTKEVIPSGNHTLRITLDKYKTHQENFTIKDGDEPKFEIDLDPNFARLEIDSAPEKGAKVFIDGEEVGTTPYVDERREAGTYTVRIEKELWSGSSETISVRPEIPTKKLLILTKDFGTLSINAPESRIYIDDKEVGFGKIKQNLKAGKYKISAKKDKHKTAEKVVFVAIGETTMERLEPIPRLGSVSVFAIDKHNPKTKIRGADIFIDKEKHKKKTPAVIQLLYGNYDISLEHSGYLDAHKSISLKEGATETITFELETYSGSVLAKRNKWRTQGWLGFTTSALLAGGGFYCNMQANDNFDNYKTSGMTVDALDYKQKSDEFSNYRDYCYYAASGTAFYAVFSWIRSAIYGSRIK